jgi:hypothetical protein
MGWWKEDGETEIVLGDEPFNLSIQLLRDISAVYSTDVGRKPRLAELLRNFEDALRFTAHEYLHDFDETEVRQLSAKTAKRKKRQEFSVGDYFALPLTNGQYGFGRIIWKGFAHLIAVLDLVSDRIKSPRELAGVSPLFHVYVTPDAWEDWSWKVLGGDGSGVPTESALPSFQMGDDVSGWRISTGNATRSTTAEEAAQFERAEIYPPKRVAWRLEATKGLVNAEDVRQRIAKGEALARSGRSNEAASEFGLAMQYAQWLPDQSVGRGLREQALSLLRRASSGMG